MHHKVVVYALLRPLGLVPDGLVGFPELVKSNLELPGCPRRAEHLAQVMQVPLNGFDIEVAVVGKVHAVETPVLAQKTVLVGTCWNWLEITRPALRRQVGRVKVELQIAFHGFGCQQILYCPL